VSSSPLVDRRLLAAGHAKIWLHSRTKHRRRALCMQAARPWAGLTTHGPRGPSHPAIVLPGLGHYFGQAGQAVSLRELGREPTFGPLRISNLFPISSFNLNWFKLTKFISNSIIVQNS
jgi:hypothetical protein